VGVVVKWKWNHKKRGVFFLRRSQKMGVRE
jgi:hypothetical protein